MAQYTVNGTCGHNSRVELFGKHTSREVRLDWMRTKPCTACWLRSQGKLAAAASKARESGEQALYQEIMSEARVLKQETA